MSVIPETRRAH